MAKGKNKLIKKYTTIHKYTSGLSLLAFLVIIISGMRADARMITIAYRACAAMICIALLSRVLIKAWASFEEIERG